jgi:hypothetical protein
MPTPIALPSCLMDCCKVLFPKLDFSRISFFEGMPPGASGAKGFTMSSGGPSPDIRIYLKTYSPCSEDTFLVIAHELVHAVQIQGMSGGGHIPGSWGAYYMSHYLGCGLRGADCDNELEKEAYDFSDGCNGGGKLRTFIDTQLAGALPCRCTKPAWPTPNSIGGQQYAGALSSLAMTESRVGRTWCSLLNFPLLLIAGGYSVFGFSNTGGAWGSGLGVVAGGILGGILGSFFGPVGAALGAALGAYLGGIIGGAIGWLIDTVFSGPSARIWFTAFNGVSWVIPDIPISQQGHTKTSKGPALAVHNNKLYTAYKSSDSNDLWYNVFADTAGWLVQDLKITQGGHTQTSEAPALAEYNGSLYLAYKSSGTNDLWYNVFDGTSWLPQDIKISQGGHTMTNKGPALAAYDGKLYLAYKSGTTNELWYNVFDGASWLPQDIKISQGGHTLTSEGPALAVYNGKLYLAYKSASSDDLWYNVFDGANWLPQDLKITQGGHTQTSQAPALAVFNGLLYMAYKSGSTNELWYNVFDGASWLPQDIKISKNGNVKTGRGPALAVAGGYLVMVYRDDS